jgi:hypothetical protein
MKAFYTDVLSKILLGNHAYTSRLLKIPTDQQAIPVGITGRSMLKCCRTSLKFSRC